MVRLKNDSAALLCFRGFDQFRPCGPGSSILSDDLAKNLQSCALDRGSCRCPCLQTSSGWERNLWGFWAFVFREPPCDISERSA